MVNAPSGPQIGSINSIAHLSSLDRQERNG
jgi:hypothetical protein